MARASTSSTNKCAPVGPSNTHVTDPNVRQVLAFLHPSAKQRAPQGWWCKPPGAAAASKARTADGEVRHNCISVSTQVIFKS